jgi:tRNA G18 (ribose-2'-O)-methylase SpoU
VKARSDRETALAYGWHSVTTMLRVAPQRIVQLHVAVERKSDARVQGLIQKAEAASVPVVWVERSFLTKWIGHGRHQPSTQMLGRSRSKRCCPTAWSTPIRRRASC